MADSPDAFYREEAQRRSAERLARWKLEKAAAPALGLHVMTVAAPFTEQAREAFLAGFKAATETPKNGD